MPLRLYAPGTRKGNKTYIARGSIGNKVYEFNTYTAEAKAAQRVARELTASIKEEQKSVPDGSKLTFVQAAKLYSDFRKPVPVEQSRIDKVVCEIGRDRIRDIRAVDVHALAVKMYPDGAAATRNRWVIRPIVTVLHYCANAGLCNWIKVPSFREPRPITRALTADAAAALIEAAETPQQRLLLTWLFLQGTRITATLKLDWDQIDIRARRVKFFNRKGDRWESFPIHAAVLAELKRTNPKEGRVFIWRDRSSLRRWLPRVCKAAGVPEFTPHMGRHTLGTMMSDNNETLKAIMGALGHSQPSSSLRYQRGDVEMVRAATGRVNLPLGRLV